MQQPRYVIGPGEYDTIVRNPFTKLPYNIVTAVSNPSNVWQMVSIPVKYDPDGLTMSGGLHHWAFIGEDGFVYVWGDSNAPAFPSTPAKTSVGNAVQVVAFDSGGDAFGAGVLVRTADGKAILIGCSQSGFRGDGSAGVSSEPTAFTIPIPEPVKDIAAAVYAYAVGVSGTAYQWGGSIQDAYWAGLASGVGKSGSALNKISTMPFGEPIDYIRTGGSYWGVAVAASKQIYGWAKDNRFIGMTSGAGQGTPINITKSMNLPGTLRRMSVGSEATFFLMENGDLYACGNNTQGAIGNGQEGKFANFVAPWGVDQVISIFVITPVKVNPTGVPFVGLWVGPAATFYAYAEDANGNLWSWGRNKGYVLWNGKGGTSAQQDKQPNTWDVLAPMKIAGFGDVSSVGAPLPAPAPPPPPAPRTVVSVTLTVLGQDIVVPASLIKKVAYSDGSTQ